MASVPSTHLVIFIAAIIVSGGLAGIIVDSTEYYADSLEESQSEYAKDVSTDVQIINDPGKPSASYDEAADTLTVYVKNVGDRIIPANSSEISVLVNGTYQSIESVTVHEETRWRPGSVIEITVNIALPSNSKTRVVVNVSGARSRFEFTTT